MYRQQQYQLDGKLLEQHRAFFQQQTAVLNTIGLLMMIVLVFVTATLLLQKKSYRRGSASSSVNIRYCKNGGQKFHSVPPSDDNDDDNGRNGRILWLHMHLREIYEQNNTHLCAQIHIRKHSHVKLYYWQWYMSYFTKIRVIDFRVYTNNKIRFYGRTFQIIISIYAFLNIFRVISLKQILVMNRYILCSIRLKWSFCVMNQFS